MRKSIVTIISLLFLFTFGCQQTNPLSEAEKLQKISTMYRNYALEFPQVKGITVEEFKQLQQQKNIVLIDVRSPEEREVSIIPSAISQAEFESDRDLYKNKSLIVYCTIGYRSGKYAQKLRTAQERVETLPTRELVPHPLPPFEGGVASLQKQGLKVFNLEGGLLAWSHIDGELINNLGSTKQVHVFGKKWQLTADGYQPVW